MRAFWCQVTDGDLIYIPSLWILLTKVLTSPYVLTFSCKEHTWETKRDYKEQQVKLLYIYCHLSTWMTRPRRVQFLHTKPHIQITTMCTLPRKKIKIGGDERMIKWGSTWKDPNPWKSFWLLKTCNHCRIWIIFRFWWGLYIFPNCFLVSPFLYSFYFFPTFLFLLLFLLIP